LQIAQALETAHEKGIVHRDLKPANVKITPEGQVKVLDFGLAKALEPETASGSGPSLLLSLSPTLTQQMTEPGLILGTAAYMSPEQARGAAVDKRADIWAFGSVLYEMLTAKRAFGGETLSDIMATILKEEVDENALPANTHSRIRELLSRCLEKDVRNRLQDIGDARIEIEKVIGGAPDETPAASTVSSRSARLWQAATAALLIVAGALGFLLMRTNSAPQEVTRAALPAPEGTTFHINTDYPGPVTISPDGRHLAFSALAENGDTLLWVRSLDDWGARPLQRTEGAQYPFWSPDSRSIGFFADNKLKKIDPSGGPPVTLCETGPAGKGGTWSDDGVIVFSSSNDTPIYRVSSAGGEATQITEIDEEAKIDSHRHPWLLPDGTHFLYLARSSQAGAEQSIRLGSIEGDIDREVFTASSQAIYASGRLLFQREQTLMAQPFDAKTLETTGEAIPVAENVMNLPGAYKGVFSASEEGTLVYLTGLSSQANQLQWLDAEDGSLEPLGDEATHGTAILSPDESRVAASISSDEGQTDLWIYETDRGLRSRFTFDPGTDVVPLWAPSGDRIVFASDREGDFDIYQKRVGGTSAEELVLKGEANQFPTGWSADERLLIYTTFEGTSSDVYALPIADGGEPIPIITTEFYENWASLSPDGRWLAYQSDESGGTEIYVTSFPTPDRKWQISTDGGLQPSWRANGTEIVFLSISRSEIYSAQVDGGGETFRIVGLRKVADVSLATNPDRDWDVNEDLSRFLINPSGVGDEIAPLSLVLNWNAALADR
jgi:Tol biopolymer transport system component